MANNTWLEDETLTRNHNLHLYLKVIVTRRSFEEEVHIADHAGGVVNAFPGGPHDEVVRPF